MAVTGVEGKRWFLPSGKERCLLSHPGGPGRWRLSQVGEEGVWLVSGNEESFWLRRRRKVML